MNAQQTEIAQLKDENVELENELKSLVLNFDDARNRLKAAEAEIERLRGLIAKEVTDEVKEFSTKLDVLVGRDIISENKRLRAALLRALPAVEADYDAMTTHDNYETLNIVRAALKLD